MFERIKKISNRLLAAGTVVAILIIVLVGIDVYQKTKLYKGISPENLLKAPKGKIVNYEVTTANNPDSMSNDSDGMVIYQYVSSRVVPVSVYEGMKEDVTKRTVNSQSFLKSVVPINEEFQREEYVTKFYPSRTFQQDGDTWYQVETATTTPAAFVSQTKLTLLDQVKEFFGQKVLADTVYSGSGDGYITNSDNGGDQGWAVVRSALTGTTANTALTSAFTGGGQSIFNSDIFIYRAFLPFDTASLPDNAEISSATINVYITADLLTADSTGFVVAVQTTQASATALVTADYDQCGTTDNPTEGSDRVLGTSITQDTFTTLTLNATGRSWISLTGYSMLGLREGHDVLNSQPAIVSDIGFSTSEETGTTQDPYLSITYAATVTKAAKINGGAIKVNGGVLKID